MKKNINIILLILGMGIAKQLFAIAPGSDFRLSKTLADSVTLIYNDIKADSFPTVKSLISVTNESGFVIGKLNENNFIVREDGVRELPIIVEELTANDIGINVVLSIDRSGSMRGRPINDAKTAANIFINLMQEKDNSAVMSFSHETRTDHDFSNNKESLALAITNIEPNGGTAIFDALVHSADLMRNNLKNRAIILLTDGADRDSYYTLQQALNALIPIEVRVFTIGLGLNQNSPEENVLKEIAFETGGMYYYSPNSSDLEEIYRAISKLLHHRYRITYNTHNTKKDGTRRYVEIDVIVNANTSSDTSSYVAPYEEPIIVDPPIVDPPVIDPPIVVPPVVEPEEEFVVSPNPFTPNNDGFNDRVEFKKGDTTPAGWTISIVDRSGKLMKKIDNGKGYWNGKDEYDRASLPGCYIYIVAQEQKIIHRGLIYLIK